jgi:predicted  nucleic acid-binding Zn-ribbon protein
MHDDLLAIHDLLKVETEMDALRTEAAQLAARVNKARRRIKDLEGQISQERSQLVVLQNDEKAKQRRVRDFTARRDRTQKLIDSGQGDYQTAVAQLNEINGLIDTCEEAFLESIDSRERQEALIVRTDELTKVAKGRARTAAERQRDRRPEIEARFKALGPLRKSRTSSLGSHLATQYADLRARKRPVLVRAVDGTCEFCNMMLPPHWVDEVRGGRRVRICRGCGCFFRDSVESAPEPSDDDDDE